MLYYDELSHHGVKGMRWGVRKAEDRYAARSKAWAAREAHASTNLGRRFAGAHRISNKYKAEQARAMSNSKTGTEMIRQQLGYEHASRRLNKNAEMSKLKADTSMTKLGKKLNSNDAYNYSQMAKHYENAAKSSKSTKKRMKYDMTHIGRVPMKTAIRGKQTTLGKEAAKALLLNIATAG